MKKVIKVFALVVLLFAIWISVDRVKNVRVENNNNGTSSLFINEGVFVKIPEELWIGIDREEFKPSTAVLYVEKYNPIFHTWDNTLQSVMNYYYQDTETPAAKSIFITESVKPYEMANIRHVLYEDTIDNVEIIYGSKTHTDYVLQLSKDDKIVNIDFYIDDLNRLMPLFESIFDDIKK